MLAGDRLDSVFRLASEVVHRMAPSEALWEVLQGALDDARQVAVRAHVFLPADLPLAVAAAVGLPESDATKLAALGTLLWTGADLLDDVADGDSSARFRPLVPAQVTLAGANLLATLPHILLGTTRSSPDVRAQVHDRIARATFRMSVGQHRDVDRHAIDTFAEYDRVVVDKAGAEIGLFAELPALLAGRSEAEVAAWLECGTELGVLAQMFTDAQDVLDPEGSDLRLGKRTGPVLLALDQLPEPQRAALGRALLRLAHGDPLALAEVESGIREGQGIALALFMVEVHRKRALDALARACAPTVPTARMRDLLFCFRAERPA